MANLTIVADVVAKAGQAEFVKSELEKLVSPTRAEDGCVQYDLHQDNHNAAHFLFFEIWESREQWLSHMQAPHLQSFQAATAESIENLSVYEMTQSAS